MPSAGRPRRHADAAAKQAAYRRRKQVEASTTARLIALQEEAAQLHIHEARGKPGKRGTLVWHAPRATAEQLQLQAELKERDMLDCLWTLQTLIADFGYDEVDRCVLQHLRRTPKPTS